MKKRVMSWLLVLVMLLGMFPASAFATDTTGAVVYVTIAVEGVLKLVRYPVTVTDTNASNTLDIDDALRIAHQEKGESYKSEISEDYGLGLKQLWSCDNDVVKGWYGYYVNNAAIETNLSEPVKAGDEIYAFIYQNKTTATMDKFSYFDSYTKTAVAGTSLELTLKRDGGSAVSGAAITINGETTNYETDTDGKVSLTFAEAGTYTVSATSSDPTLVPPVCVVTVEEAAEPELEEFDGNLVVKVNDAAIMLYDNGTEYCSQRSRDLQSVKATVPAGTTSVTITSKSYYIIQDVYTVVDGTHTKVGGSSQTRTLNVDVSEGENLICIGGQIGTFHLNLTVEAAGEEPAKYTVTVSETQNGTVTASPTAAEAGEEITLTVTPGDGYELDTLTVTPAEGEAITPAQQSDGTYKFIMPESNVTVAATFKTTEPELEEFSGTLVVKVNNEAITLYDNGTESCSRLSSDLRSVKATVPAGTASVTITSISGAMIQEVDTVVDDAHTKVGGGFNVKTVPVNVSEGENLICIGGAIGTFHLNLTVEAAGEEPTKYTVTVNKTENGTVTASPTEAEAGAEITLTVTPGDGYELDTLTVTPAEGEAITPAQQSDGTYKFIMPASDVTVTATFKAIPKYTITVTGTTYGSVTASPASAAAGTEVTLTVKPEEGCELQSLTVTMAGTANTVTVSKVGNSNNYTFKMPDANVTVTAVFVKLPTYQITVETATNGSVSADMSQAIAGTTVTLTVTAAEGYELDKLTVAAADGGSPVVTKETDTTYTFPMPADDVTVTASFREIVIPTITVHAGNVQAQPGQIVDVPMWIETNIPEENLYTELTLSLSGVSGLTLGIPYLGNDPGGSVYYSTNCGRGTITLHGIGIEPLPTGKQLVMVPVQVASNAADGTYTVTPNASAKWLNEENALEAQTVKVAGTITVSGEPVDEEGAIWPTISVGNVETIAGNKVYVPIIADHTLTTLDMATFLVKVTMPEGFTLTSMRPTDELAAKKWSCIDMSDNTMYNGWTFGSIEGWRPLPVGEIIIMEIDVAADVKDGTYKLDLTEANMSGSTIYDPIFSGFTLVDGSITIENPTAKTKLTAPTLTADNVVASEHVIVVNIPESTQEPAAVKEYAISSDNGETWSDWQTSNVFKKLTESTQYWISVRYNAYNDTYFEDSDRSTALTVSTITNPDPNIQLTMADVAGSPGETVQIPVTIQHSFEGRRLREVFLFVDNTTFATVDPLEEGTLTEGLVARIDNSTGKQLGIRCKDTKQRFMLNDDGVLVILQAKIPEDAAPGAYEYKITSIIVRGAEADDSSNQYPKNLSVTPATITVKTPLDAPVLADAVATDDTITVTAPAIVPEKATVEYSLSADNGTNWSDWQESNIFTVESGEKTYLIRARFISGTNDKANSAPGEAISVATRYPEVRYTVGETTGYCGDTAEVTVTLEHAITKQVTSFQLVPEVGDQLVLTGAKAGSALSGDHWRVACINGIVTIYQNESTAFDVPKGEVVILTFAVAETAEETDYVVSLSEKFDANGNAFSVDDTVMGINGTVTDGKIAVKKVHYGDINKDRIVDSKDLVSLRRYLASWSAYTAETLDLTAADVNIDGAVSMTDAIILSRHLVAVADDSSWQDYKTLPYKNKK